MRTRSIIHERSIIREHVKEPKTNLSLSFSLSKVMSRQECIVDWFGCLIPLEMKIYYYPKLWWLVSEISSPMYVPWPSVRRLTQKWEMEKEDHEKQQKSSMKRKPKLIITIINLMCKIGLSPLMGLVKSKTDCGRVIKALFGLC